VKHIISLGAGVQSSTMALMAAHGEITPMPDCAIFADTHAEPQEVYDWLDKLEPMLPFPVYRVEKGNLAEEATEIRYRKRDGLPRIDGYIPAYMETGLLGRTCTNHFKIQPQKRKYKELLGLKKQDRWPKETAIVSWLGISTDEIQRMKMQVDPWQDFRHPLIEMGMTRHHCIEWMEKNGYPKPPRSACTFCPFRSDEEWRDLNAGDFKSAVKFEEEMQKNAALSVDAGVMGSIPYVHRSRVKLDEVDFFDDTVQQSFSFNDECAGMCGV